MNAPWWKLGLKGLRWCLWSLMALLILVLALLTALLGTQPGSRWVLDQIREPLPLALGAVSGTWLTGLNLEYVTYEEGAQRYHLEGLSFRWQPLALLGGNVSIQSLRARRIEVHLPATGETDPAGVEEGFTPPSLHLPLGFQLEALELRQIVIHQGETSQALPSISAALSARGSELRLHQLRISAEQYQASLSGRVTLAKAYPLRLDIQWRYGPDSVSLVAGPGTDLVFRGRGQLSGDLDQLVLDHQLTSPQQLEAHLMLTPALTDPQANPQLSVRGHWPQQSLVAGLLPTGWPALETEGQLELSGWLDSYRLTLSSRAQVEDSPALALDLQARGTGQTLALEQVQLDTQQGRLQGSGSLTWVPDWAGELRLNLAGFNPAALPLPGLADWPGDIHGELAASLIWVEGQPQVQVPTLALSGQLRDRPLQLDGQGNYKGQSWRAESIRLGWGESRAQLSASLGDSLALDLSLDLPNLGDFYAGLEGSVTGRAKLSGAPENPRGQVQLGGQHLAWQGQSLQSLSLSASGVRDRHQLSLVVNSEVWGSAQLSLAGAYESPGWQGELTGLSLQPLNYLAWELKTPAPLNVNPTHALVSALCLAPRRVGTSPREPLEGELCLDGQWRAQGDNRAEVQLRQLPLGLARRWLPPELGLEGSLEGRASFEQPSGGPPRAQMRLQTREGVLRYPLDEEDAEEYAWRDTRFSADWQPEGAQAQVSLDWQGLGQGAADLAWQAASDELSGQMQLDFTDLALLEALLPFLHQVTGRLALGLQLGGSLAQPELKGELRLSDASAKLPAQGLFLKDVNLEARADKSRMDITASLVSDPGSLRLEGRVDRPWAQNAQVEARLSGESVTAVNLPELKVQVSPDLRLQASRQELRLDGTARIPVLLVQFKSLPESAVQVSEDVVVAGSEADQEPQGPAVYADLDLVLGEDVRLEGFGLKSRLTGELNLLQTPERGLTTLGQVSVTEGRYKAYGQDLTIERGQLLFQGPYNNPGLDIRATRTAGDQVAGLEIGGTLQRPRSRVFSDPSMPDSEAMSILFTGKPLSRSSSTEASMLVNAIGGLGLERSGFITAEIADTFNLDEFRVQTEDDVTQSSLHIGKRLTPRIFVRYAVGLFDRSSTLGLRYDLTEQLHLDAESGLQQSLDLIYKLERD